MNRFLLLLAIVSLPTASFASGEKLPTKIRQAALQATSIPGKVRVSGIDNKTPWAAGTNHAARDSWTVSVTKGTAGKGQQFQNLMISNTGRVLDKEPVQKNVGRATDD